jgi:hypothetical protein
VRWEPPIGGGSGEGPHMASWPRGWLLPARFEHGRGPDSSGEGPHMASWEQHFFFNRLAALSRLCSSPDSLPKDFPALARNRSSAP